MRADYIQDSEESLDIATFVNGKALAAVQWWAEPADSALSVTVSLPR